VPRALARTIPETPCEAGPVPTLEPLGGRTQGWIWNWDDIDEAIERRGSFELLPNRDPPLVFIVKSLACTLGNLSCSGTGSATTPCRAPEGGGHSRFERYRIVAEPW